MDSKENKIKKAIDKLITSDMDPIELFDYEIKQLIIKQEQDPNYIPWTKKYKGYLKD